MKKNNKQTNGETFSAQVMFYFIPVSVVSGDETQQIRYG